VLDDAGFELGDDDDDDEDDVVDEDFVPESDEVVEDGVDELDEPPSPLDAAAAAFLVLPSWSARLSVR
jgi:hypothetical protein